MLMGGDEEALKLMDSYTSNKTLGQDMITVTPLTAAKFKLNWAGSQQ